MARKTMRAPLVLADESRKLLTELSGSMTAPVREVVRARVLLHYANGAEISSIKRHVGISRPAIIHYRRARLAHWRDHCQR